MEQKQLINYMSSRGFVWGPSPELYGGVAGFYEYGPNGKLLKNNIEAKIRKTFSFSDFWEVECPIVSPESVWVASGHAGNFSDPLIVTKNSKSNFRVDKLIEENFPDVNAGNMSDDELIDFIKKNKIVAPNGEELILEIKRHILMMKTTLGVSQLAYNRPETATSTYLPFLNYLEHFRNKLPFGVFQIGKAFRNEISPRQHLLRMREFTQAEGQLFIEANNKINFDKFNSISKNKLPFWSADDQINKKAVSLLTINSVLKNNNIKSQAYAWALYVAYDLFLSFGFDSDKIRLRQHLDNEKAFYANDAWDIEIFTNTHGWIEVCGIHDRGNYDLNQHSKHSGRKLEAVCDDGKKIVPHIIEIAFGIDRPIYCLLDNYLTFNNKNEGKNILKIPYDIAPIKIAILPLMNKDSIINLSKEIYSQLKNDYICYYDKGGSIGKRYLRQDEIGTPFCITIDFDSVEKNSITIRDRDSESQIKIPIGKMSEILDFLINKKKSFKDYGEYLI
ncbi:glycine--tRNA ligase [Candidatus Woesearchaeota archaeon]|jgi:glycyl-tRNA synthetase|nr:glycine--tRNA ligase [Candidatus Woesearchaeota archaeon]MBT4387268.1 glycine--tRNA ligase [Candidatus Woesearchaeota archaeon]MBT4596269.1 glycine--tRNA ligase [Candidatus Woesearchaeota archaeon]MBT5741508.1 glycine--tRNA ligase [Candidatus Woesearchaeota archaeon]MBT6505375.1 glycine--tRNA ligase [Candidatus Woesearchaeota archaeon]